MVCVTGYGLLATGYNLLGHSYAVRAPRGKTMKPGRKRVILRALAVLVIVLGIIVLAFLPWEEPPEAKARRLMAELWAQPGVPGKPSAFRKWLVDLGVLKRRERRDPHDIVKELAALGAPAVPALITGLTDWSDVGVGEWSAEALSKIGRPAVPALVDALKGEEPRVRQRAARALYYIGPEAADAIPALLQACNGEERNVRSNAALAMGSIAPAEDRVVRALIALLQDEDAYVRACAAISLGDIGPGAKAAVPALEKALKDKSSGVRETAAQALKKIQTAPASRKKVHCFYGTSASFSSGHDALNGAMFATIIEKDGEVICKVVFSHRLKVYKSIIRKRAIKLKGGIRFEGIFTIDDAKIPFHLELRGGKMFGRIGKGLDKGVIVLNDFDTD